MAGLDAIGDWLSSLWLSVHLFLLRAVLFFTQNVEQRTLPKRISEGTRSILVIGDEVAEGLGDGLGRTGLVRTLDKQLREARSDGRLRLPWRVMTAGRTDTNPQNWLPEGKLFERVFPSSAVHSSDPHVVIILFSARDNLEQGAQAPPVSHIIRITDALIQRGIYVVVPDFVNFHGRESSQFSAVNSANDALRQTLEHLKSRLRDNNDANKNKGFGSVVFSTDISKVTAMAGHVVTQLGDFWVFNSFGYKQLAAELRDDVTEVARKVEWVYWKERLNN